jgi:hypothetical protein
MWGGSIERVLEFASRRAPSVGVYDCMNVSAESAACRGKPVKSPVGHHHNLPELRPFCQTKKVNNNAFGKMSGTYSIQGNIDWLHNTSPDPVQIPIHAHFYPFLVSKETGLW